MNWVKRRMDICDLYEVVAVKVECNGNVGSGCLYQPSTEDYSYVLTAKHCLTGKQGEEKEFELTDIMITASSEVRVQQRIKPIEYIVHTSMDLAIVVIEFIPNLPKYLIDNPVLGSDVRLNGFPAFMKGDRKSITSTVHECSHKKTSFEVVVNNNQLTNYSNNESVLVEGFSGSGVFMEKEENSYLVGIFPRFTAEEGAYHSLTVIKTEEYNSLLKNRDRAQLIPNYLSSFKEYIMPAFEARSENIAMILNDRAEGLEEITPLMIKDTLNEKMLLPYGEINSHDRDIWIGWITLLTYLNIESEERDFSLMCTRNQNGNEQKVRMFYSYKHKRLPDLFKVIMNNKVVYNDIGPNDCIVINHEGNSGEVLRLSQERMSKIVMDIGVSRLQYMHKIPRIDQPTITKNISLIHVDSFKEKFREFAEIDDFVELEESLRSSIKEVLNGG